MSSMSPNSELVSLDKEPEAVEITVDRLVTGDRPSILYFGMVGAHAIRKDEMAVFMVDALGRVCLMPPEAIHVVTAPRIADTELNSMEEEMAINVLIKQGDNDTQIMEYLTRRPR